MEQHFFLRLAAAGLMTFSLAASPVLAGSSIREQFLAFLPGINGDGNLNFGSYAEDDENRDGDFVVITTLVNTYTGKFYFKASGKVINESNYAQFYTNKNFFISDLTDGELYSNVYIYSSCYSVSKPYRYISYVTYTGFAADQD